jgi:acyl-coenzyme A thioesterase PaaI-like protein
MLQDATKQFVEAAFAAQSPLRSWDAQIDLVAPQIVRLSMPITPAVTTFNGAVVGGVIATLADVAAGLALITSLDPPRGVITLDFTSQQLAPAIGVRLIAVGRAERAGRAIGFASAEAFALTDQGGIRVARLSATFSIAS